MRPMLLALSLLLFVSCASGTAGGRPAPSPEPRPKEKSAPQKIQARDIHEVKAAISRNLTSAEKARIGFSAHPDETSRKIAEKLETLFTGSVSLELAGLDGLTPEETLAQLDPRNIPSMAYINYKRDGDLAVSLYATDGTMARDLFFDYKYSDISPALSARMERVASLPFRAEHAACDDEGNMYLRNGQATVILSPGAGKELFRGTSPCGRPSFFEADGTVSLFCAETGTAIIFTRTGDTFREEAEPSLPLPSRASRFLFAGRDENGGLSLFNKMEEPLGQFDKLTVFSSSGVTVFAAISPAGDIWGLRGDLVTVIPETLKGPYASIAPAPDVLYALRRDGAVEKISLSAKFEWKVAVLDTGMEKKASAIACSPGRLLLFCPEEGGTTIYSITDDTLHPGGE